MKETGAKVKILRADWPGHFIPLGTVAFPGHSRYDSGRRVFAATCLASLSFIGLLPFSPASCPKQHPALSGTSASIPSTVNENTVTQFCFFASAASPAVQFNYKVSLPGARRPVFPLILLTTSAFSRSPSHHLLLSVIFSDCWPS